jgi:DNA invertase Pin-like site-specific DNA recombinase
LLTLWNEKKMKKLSRSAVAYLRTSSAANVGADKDSDKRQLAGISAFAAADGYEILESYYDAAVSGADPVTERPGFMEMLRRVVSNGAKTIIVESPDRFARDLMVQLAGHDMLKSQGISLIPATAPDFFMEETPTALLVRQVLGAIAQFEKASIVAKLAVARKRKRETAGKCEGRKSLVETHPETVAIARKLRRRKPKGGQLSLRAVASELAALGHLNERGMQFNPKSVAAML